MYKIIGSDGREYGPVSAEQLSQWIREGRVNATTRVLAEGATEWKTIREMPEFAASVFVAPAATATGDYLRSAAAGQVSGPAIGLMVTAVLGFCVQIVTMLALTFGIVPASGATPAETAWTEMFSGPWARMSSVIGILMSFLIFFGALRMKRLQNYGLAIAASIIALVPCTSPCCLIGLPIGVWALIVLSRSEVKAAFA